MKNLAVDFNPKILRYLMRESGETLQTLSKKSGVSVATIWRMREGKYVPSWPTLDALAVVFDIEPISFCALGDDECEGVKLNAAGVVMNFSAAKLVAAREEMGLTKSEFSKESGIHFDIISKYERGIAKPRLKNLQRLARFFNVPPGYFCDDDDSDPLAVDSMFEEMEDKRELLARFIKYSY